MARAPEQAEKGAEPERALELFIDSVRAKANHNEWMARIGVALVLASTYAIPVFIVASTRWYPFLYGKFIPALLAAVAGATAGWLQWARPNERWLLYRGYQRAAEVERLRYERCAPPYVDEQGRKQTLVQRLTALELSQHDDWAGLIPKSSDVLTKSSDALPPGAKPPAGEA